MSELETYIEKQKIQELCARYTLTLDSHDIEGWANCFTEHGAFGHADRALRGREKIVAYGQVHKHFASRHLTTSMLYEIDASGQRATGQSTTVLCFATRQGYKIAFFGRYEDEIVKVDGSWLLAQRWVHADSLPDDPTFDVLGADSEVAPMIQKLLDAFERLGETV